MDTDADTKGDHSLIALATRLAQVDPETHTFLCSYFCTVVTVSHTLYSTHCNCCSVFRFSFGYVSCPRQTTERETSY